MSTTPGDARDDAPTELLGRERGIHQRSSIATGQRIGAYLLKRALGAGGMGEVWLAEQQEPVRRPVALKLMRTQIAGPLSEAFFEVERQALARMEHPAIAKVFDAGRTEGGHPWFAMEWVDGAPLDAWCREHTPSLEQRLRLIAALARGVQHAHQRGVVHRDLKPANVLVAEVDGAPQPKLIDFGIALGLGAVASGAQPHSYEAAGSGAYMSPEQRAGLPEAIDPRADVYALGMVLLCLLLPRAQLSVLGGVADDSHALQSALQQALRGRDPSGVLADLPRPLLWMLLRATAPVQADRYASAELLAGDIERFLAQRPVSAAPASRRYRLSCFLRRNALAVGAGAVVVLALGAGLAAALYGLSAARSEAVRARATSDFMADVLTGVDPQHAGELDRRLLMLILEDAARNVESKLSAQPAALAEIESVIGSTYMGVGEAELAREYTTRAMGRADAELAEDSYLRLRVLRRYADMLVNHGEAAAAEAVLAPVISGDLVSSEPRAQADLELTAVWALRDQNKFHQALQMAERALARVRDLSLDGERDPDPLQARYTRAIALIDLERYEAAEAELLPLVDDLAAVFGESDARLQRVLNSLAVMRLQQGRYAEAVPVLERALAASEKVFGPSHSMTLTVVSNLGGALRQSGQVAASGPVYKRALDGFVEKYGETHPRAILTRHNHANYLLEAGQAQASLDEQQRAFELAVGAIGEQQLLSSEILVGQGKALLALGRLDEAQAQVERALGIKRELFADGHRTIGKAEAVLADIEQARGDAQ
jgi:tetratricopeptide (TPR) repeat protein